MTVDDENAIDNAWRVHSQLADWTGQADLKARFALSFVSALIAGILAVYGDGSRLYGGESRITDFSRFESASFVLGIFCMVVGLLVSVAAVTPRLRARASKQEYRTSFVYFGHLRHWKEDDLALELKKVDILPMLARQLVNMSKILWHKHRAIKCSLASTLIGLILIGLAEFFANV